QYGQNVFLDFSGNFKPFRLSETDSSRAVPNLRGARPNWLLWITQPTWQHSTNTVGAEVLCGFPIFHNTRPVWINTNPDPVRDVIVYNDDMLQSGILDDRHSSLLLKQQVETTRHAASGIRSLTQVSNAPSCETSSNARSRSCR